MTFGTNCLCDGRADIKCTRIGCDIAGPGEPGNANSCRPCWLRLKKRSSLLAKFAPSACSHLGVPTGQTASCDGCGMSGRTSEVMGCEKHGVCTVEYSANIGGRKLAHCRGCQDYSPRPVLQVKTHSAGIGDSLLVMPTAEGLRRQHPESEVVIVAPQFAHEWMSLFGRFRIVEEQVRAPLCFCDNTGDYPSFSQARLPRWRFWANKFGTKPALPEPVSIPKHSEEWAVQYAGAIVMSPFAAYPERTWEIGNWVEVERQLDRLGFKVVAIDDRPNRCNTLKCGGKIVGQSPTNVAAVMRSALCFAGNDSGMAHVAGFYDTPSIVVEGISSDTDIMGLYPRTRSVGGRGRKIASVTPDEVVCAILEQVQRSVDLAFPTQRFLQILPDRDKYREPTWPPIYAALWDTVRSIHPTSIVEIGGRAGASAWVMLEACPDARVVSYDIDECDPTRICDGGYDGSAAHARLILADRPYTRVAANSLTLESIPACDLCYIDGEHSESACLSDMRLAECSGARAILCDDYCLGGVRSAVEKFMQENPHRLGRFIPSQTGLFLITDV